MTTMFLGWVSNTPPVIYYACDIRKDISSLLPDFPIYRLRKHAWSCSIDEILEYHDRALRSRPQDTLIHLTNTADTADTLTALGLPAYFVSHNCFLDENLFTIQPGAEKEFDAVYNARMAPFKRHELSKNIANPLFIGGTISWKDSQEHFTKVREAIPQGTFTHAEEPKSYISPQTVCDLLNRSRVGLCLSDKEGGMYAAVEYLLCGLPVVTTQNEGGRDEFFDTRYVRTVPDEASAVARAVYELIDLRPSPEFIRRKTIERMRVQRRRFVDLLQSIFNAEGLAVDADRYFYTRFRSKLGRWYGNVTSERIQQEFDSLK